MGKHNKILELITEIRNSNPVMMDIFLLGSCFNFYHILKVVFPESICYYGQVPGHVITKIENRFYDISGEIKDISEYCPIKEIWVDKYKNESDFKSGDMYVGFNKAEYIRQ